MVRASRSKDERTGSVTAEEDQDEEAPRKNRHPALPRSTPHPNPPPKTSGEGSECSAVIKEREAFDVELGAHPVRACGSRTIGVITATPGASRQGTPQWKAATSRPLTCCQECGCW